MFPVIEYVFQFHQKRKVKFHMRKNISSAAPNAFD